MAPSIRVGKLASNNYTIALSPLPAPTRVDSSGTIVNVIFGVLALIIGIITVWQAQRAYYLWHRHENQQDSSRTTGMQLPNLNEEICCHVIPDATDTDKNTPHIVKGFDISTEDIRCSERSTTAESVRKSASVAKVEEV